MTERSVADYVVVGAGSAGSVIARRLSDAGRHVHVIEAGGTDGDPAIHEPAGWVTLLQNGSHDWGLLTTSQEAANNRTIPWARGKVLGGCSSVNAMVYVRGHSCDYDGWAKATGDPGWAWNSVLPIFKRSEANELGANEYHGAGGLQPVSSNHNPQPLSMVFVDSAVTRGHKLVTDFNAAQMEGVGYVQTTTDAGRRISVWQGFMAPILDKRKLTVTTDALVHRVIIENGRAVAVEYSDRAGVLRRAYAAAEVVLSAGVIGSPQVLQLSGIGPGSELRAINVDTIVDLPGVGANLHDHPMLPVLYEATAPLPASTNNLAEAQLFARSTVCPSDAPPDLQHIFLHFPVPVAGYPALEHGYAIAAGLVAPKSRGTLRLVSSDPKVLPMADPKMLADPDDLQAMVDAVEMCREIGASRPFAPWRKREVAPGPLVRSRAELVAFVRQSVATYFHPVGTCKMGAVDDPDAVVGPDLRVRGVESLRVADASVMPTVPHGNTNAPAIMIGERAADLILGRAE